MEAYNFISGVEYRRQALLEFVGSKQAQSGVIWGTREPGCLICTSGGRHGKKVGYSDEPLPDGSWRYFGQGTVGDQSTSNPANRKLASGENSVLLFTTREPTSKEVATQGGYGKLFTFRGLFNVGNTDIVIPNSGPRKGNRLLRFLLVPAAENMPLEVLSSKSEGIPQKLSELQAYLNSSPNGAEPGQAKIVEYRRRSKAVQRYALLRANGSCELCLAPAPFLGTDGAPFLEVHHLKRLADDGPDAPHNVAAICPNCHKAAHYSKYRFDINSKLTEKIEEKEKAISNCNTCA